MGRQPGARTRPRAKPRSPRPDPTRGLVGRHAEIARFRDALAGEGRVLYVHGQGGVGKTTLLDACAAICRAARVAHARVDGRDVECVPGALARALAKAIGAPGVDPVAFLERRRRGRTVLFVDAYEQLAPIDRFVREGLHRALPDRVLLVLAGRTPPSPEWRGEPGWGSTILPLIVDNLPAEDARRLLRARGVGLRHEDAAVSFTRGHPLAVCLTADLLARRPDARLTMDDAPDVVQALLGRFVEDLDDPDQQAALDASCLVRSTTEPLLAAMLGREDVRPLLRWLASLSFMELRTDGVAPHDLARDVLAADLKWRNPDRVAALLGRASAHYAARLQRRQATDQFRLAEDLLYIHSHHPVVGAFTPWRGVDGITVESARPEDVGALVKIVEQHEGRAAAAIASRWLDRQLDQAIVARDASDVPAGFQISLRLDRARPDDLAGDPLAQQAWRHVQERGRPARGHSVLLTRFLMARDTYQGQSTIQSIVGSQCMRAYLVTPKLDWAYTVMAEPEQWTALLKAAFGAEPLPPLELDGRKYGLFYHCFRDRTPGAWLAWLAQRGIAADDGAEPSARTLTREEIDDAVNAALRDLHRPHALADNPLLDSPLIAAGRADAAPAEALRALLDEAAAALASTPQTAKLELALRHAYFEPAPSQQEAARRAGVPFGTFRRHVAQAVAQLVAILAHRQREV